MSLAGRPAVRWEREAGGDTPRERAAACPGTPHPPWGGCPPCLGTAQTQPAGSAVASFLLTPFCYQPPGVRGEWGGGRSSGGVPGDTGWGG